MKFRNIFLILFLSSCTTYGENNYKSFTQYSSKGFALIYDENDFNNKIISKKLDSSKPQVAHRKLSKNKILVITNPENKKSIELKVSKKIKYPNFFNIIITEEVSKKLDLNPQFPYIEVYQRVKNKSFVAKEAEIHSEEKNVFGKAPVEKIKIDNISKNETNQNYKNNKKEFFILIGVFYNKNPAYNLKNSLIEQNINKELLIVKNLGKNRFQLTSGPYYTINALKNDYFKLNMYGFDDLDIIKK